MTADYSTASKPMMMAKIQMRQPHDVEQPSPMKSNIQPKTFITHPKALNANTMRTTTKITPTISIILSFIE